ncbi:helix-turn-helix transcriptional regulator [Herbaspirillum chlorophenolicum]|uniref:Helix-turn-helix transcriptional regulator n=1 Tax=Herbaspirillum chlorophenolicum TaxID=211589 RepID=A0ABW8EY12_9BURK
MDNDLARRRALGEFIKTQREQTPPAQAGLPQLSLGGRRRTPGLRREEVAQLCGISVTWYTWIEQGRTDSVSPQALSRLAEALHLPRAKRAYLFELAGKKDPVLPEHGDESVIAPEIVEVVRNFRAPAYLMDRYWNAVAWNPAARKLFTGWLDTRAGSRNLLHFMFCTEEARQLTADWEQRARRVVAEFRADCAALLDDPQVASMVEELSARNALFKRAWRLQDVVEREGGERRFHHPQMGELSYRQVNFRVANRPDLKLVTLMPDSAGTDAG